MTEYEALLPRLEPKSIDPTLVAYVEAMDKDLSDLLGKLPPEANTAAVKVAWLQLVGVLAAHDDAVADWETVQ